MSGRLSSTLNSAQARAELAGGDARQASEKGWGAAAQIVKAVANSRGWQHRGHSLLFDAVGDLRRVPAFEGEERQKQD